MQIAISDDIIGAPGIYHSDEVGLKGGDNPDCR
jgi:hypothetical protein